MATTTTLTGPVSVVFFDKKANPSQASAWCIRSAGQVPPKNHYPVALVGTRDVTLLGSSLPINDAILLEARRQVEMRQAQDIGGDLETLYPEWSERDLDALAEMLITHPHGGSDEQIHRAARAAHLVVRTAIIGSSIGGRDRRDPRNFIELLGHGTRFLVRTGALIDTATLYLGARALHSVPANPHNLSQGLRGHGVSDMRDQLEHRLVTDWLESLDILALRELEDILELELLGSDPESDANVNTALWISRVGVTASEKLD